MKIKEFAHKYSLTFFYTTIILAIILIITLVVGLDRDRYGRDRFENRKDMMMKNGYNRDVDRGGQMMRQQRSLDVERNISPTEENTISTTSVQ